MDKNDFWDPDEEQWEDDLYEEEIRNKKRFRFFTKIVALFTILILVVFAAQDICFFLSDKLDFLDENRALREDKIVMMCKRAVVSVRNVDANHRERLGSGFNLSSKGIILTNWHVVDQSGTITIQFADGKIYYSKEYRRIEGADAALIWVDGNNLLALPLDTKETVETGDSVTIIGNPLGFERISQRGKVGHFHSVKNSKIPVFDISISVNPGNSGGPVINERGQVVGIVFASTNMPINGKAETRALAIPILNLLPKLKNAY